MKLALQLVQKYFLYLLVKVAAVVSKQTQGNCYWVLSI